MNRFEKYLNGNEEKNQKEENNTSQQKEIPSIGIKSVPEAVPPKKNIIKVGGISKIPTEKLSEVAPAKKEEKVSTETPPEVPPGKEKETESKEGKEKKLQKELEDTKKEIKRIEEELKEAKTEEEQARNRAADLDNDPDYQRAMDRVTNLNGELEQRQKEKEEIEKLIEELKS